MKPFVAFMLVVLFSGCASDRDEGMASSFGVGQSAEEQDPKRVLHWAVRAVRYSTKEGAAALDSDVFVTVGEQRFAFDRQEQEGFFAPEVCEQIMTNPSREIRCLCSPEYVVVYVLKDQQRMTCGAVALSRNHNSLAVFNRNGTLISNHRFQNFEPSKDNPLFFTTTDSINLFALAEGLIK